MKGYTMESAIRARDTFGLECWRELQTMRHTARALWPNSADDRDEGTQETLAKAIANADKFDGRNLAAWLNTIMRNIKRDQCAKAVGYRRGSGASLPRIEYRGGYDDYTGAAEQCDPEAILIAKQEMHTHKPAKGGWRLNYWQEAFV